MGGQWSRWPGTRRPLHRLPDWARSARRPQRRLNPAETPAAAWGEVVFPNPHHPPAAPAQRSMHKAITGLVGGEFLLPEGAVVRREAAMPRTTVPEAAIHEHCNPVLGKNEIRFDPRLPTRTGSG